MVEQCDLDRLPVEAVADAEMARRACNMAARLEAAHKHLRRPVRDPSEPKLSRWSNWYSR